MGRGEKIVRPGFGGRLGPRTLKVPGVLTCILLHFLVPFKRIVYSVVLVHRVKALKTISEDMKFILQIINQCCNVNCCQNSLY